MSGENETLICGLKYQVARQAGMKRNKEEIAQYNLYRLMKAWNNIHICNGEDPEDDYLKEEIWDYIESSKFFEYIEAESKSLGIYSKIGEYENKKGHKSLAHFTVNNCYLGSVKELGNNPISYKGNFKICRELFDVDLTKLKTIAPFSKISYLFISKHKM